MEAASIQHIVDRFLEISTVVRDSLTMARGLSKEQHYYRDFLEAYGRPASASQVAWAIKSFPESAQAAAAEPKIGHESSQADRSRWNSVNRGLNNLVKRGELVKVVEGRSTRFAYPSEPFRFRHFYKTQALDLLAREHLSDAHYTIVIDSGATAKELLDAIQGPAGFSPDAMVRVLHSMVIALEEGDQNDE